MYEIRGSWIEHSSGLVPESTPKGYLLIGLKWDAANRTAANHSTKQVQISMQAERSQQTLATATNTVLSARYVLRNIIVTA